MIAEGWSPSSIIVLKERTNVRQYFLATGLYYPKLFGVIPLSVKAVTSAGITS
jgi:hypothetical protein